MIQFQRQALFLCHENGRIEPLGSGDLVSCLEKEASLQHIEPWALEKVVECIVRHYKDELKREQIPLSEFLELAQTLLLTYTEESMRGPARLELDLFKTAKECGTGFELKFFSELRSFLAKQLVAASQSEGLRITGLRRCAKYLSGRRRWSKRCSEMRNEIIEFIRTEAIRLGKDKLLLSVHS